MNKKFIIPIIWMVLILVQFIVRNNILILMVFVLSNLIVAITVFSIASHFIPQLSLIIPSYVTDIIKSKITFLMYAGISVITLIYSYMGVWSSVFKN